MPTKAKKPTLRPIKLSAKQPKTGNLNGTVTVHPQLQAFGDALLIMKVSCSQVVDSLGSKQPVMTIEHIEGLPVGALADSGAELLERAAIKRRSDDGVLPGMEATNLADARRDRGDAGGEARPPQPGDLDD